MESLESETQGEILYTLYITPYWLKNCLVKRLEINQTFVPLLSGTIVHDNKTQNIYRYETD